MANFQETAVIQIHLTGAFLSFGSGCVYMLIQSWIAFRMHPFLAGKQIAKIRLGIALASVVCFFTGYYFWILPPNFAIIASNFQPFSLGSWPPTLSIDFIPICQHRVLGAENIGRCRFNIFLQKVLFLGLWISLRLCGKIINKISWNTIIL